MLISLSKTVPSSQSLESLLKMQNLCKLWRLFDIIQWVCNHGLHQFSNKRSSFVTCRESALFRRWNYSMWRCTWLILFVTTRRNNWKIILHCFPFGRDSSINVILRIENTTMSTPFLVNIIHNFIHTRAPSIIFIMPVVVPAGKEWSSVSCYV